MRIRPLIQIIIVFALLAALGSIATGLIVRQGLQAGIQGSCHRLNVKQREDNGAQFGNYLSDREFLALIAQTSGRQTASARRETAQFVIPERFAERMQAWVPLTARCDQVGPSFTPPQAVPFYQRLPDARDLPPSARPPLAELSRRTKQHAR